MKALVVYDSIFSNTAKVAKVIGGTFGNGTKVAHVHNVRLDELDGIDLLVVGSPTHGGKPTAAIQNFVDQISPTDYKHLAVTAFDTRVPARIVKLFGFAADKLADTMHGNGASLAVVPEGFFVTGKEGPLKDGELERAAKWAKTIKKMETSLV